MMGAYYDNQIVNLVTQSDRPLRHREIAERLAPGNNRAWGAIGTSLTQLYRAGLLAREKTDGRYWHYTAASAPPLLDRLAALLAAARAYRDARRDCGVTMGPLAIGAHWERLKATIDALDERE